MGDLKEIESPIFGGRLGSKEEESGWCIVNKLLVQGRFCFISEVCFVLIVL
jgi:hypothetical protein